MSQTRLGSLSRKRARQIRLRHRAITIIAQDRVDTLAATTGWRPPGIRSRRSTHG